MSEPGLPSNIETKDANSLAIVEIPARFMNLQHVAIGRIVHYQLPLDMPNGSSTTRPALVVAVTDNNTVNLQVFVDGPNDMAARGPHAFNTYTDWVTDAKFDSGEPAPKSHRRHTLYLPRTWHWPERV